MSRTAGNSDRVIWIGGDWIALTPMIYLGIIT